jgi:prepilin-type N-terminal cleavage/methylation domain-containing protein
MRIKDQSGRRHAGFTLVELLVVLMILVILATLVTAGISRFSARGPALATQTNLDKARSALVNQYAAVRTAAQNDSLSASPNSTLANQAKTNVGATSLQDPRVRTEYIRLKLIQAFPTSFSEAFWPDGNQQSGAPNAFQGYVTYLGQANIAPGNSNTWNSTPPAVQESICVLMILQVGPRNGGLTADDLGTEAVGPVTIMPSQGQTQGFVDGWRRAVAFTRSYDGTPNTLALLSAGKDGLFGVYDVTLTTKSPGGANPPTVGPIPPQSSDPVGGLPTFDNVLGYTP